LSNHLFSYTSQTYLRFISLRNGHLTEIVYSYEYIRGVGVKTLSNSEVQWSAILHDAVTYERH